MKTRTGNEGARQARAVITASVPINLAVTVVVALLVVAPTVAARAAIYYSWSTPTSGSIADPLRWTPSGVPGPLDYAHFGQAGTYSVTFPAAVPQTHLLSCNGGDVTWHLISPHSSTGIEVGNSAGSMTLTMMDGSLSLDYVHLGFAGGFNSLVLTRAAGPATTAATLRSRSRDNPYPGGLGGDYIGWGGIVHLDILAGARYIVEGQGNSWPVEIAATASAAVTVNIAGFSSGPTVGSSLQLQNGVPLHIGARGVANVFCSNRGNIAASGDVILGRFSGASGYVTIGPATVGSASLVAAQNLWIGNNDVQQLSAGHGELTVRDRGLVRVAGQMVIGDVDNPSSQSSVLRVAQGGIVVMEGGLRVWPTDGPGLDLRGGVTRLAGGQLYWPVSKRLTVSSTVGTPELWISNGISNIGPWVHSPHQQLVVGRSGSGRLWVTRPGTVLRVGSGEVALADSAGGFGKVVIDSSAVFTSDLCTILVGVRGAGEFTVRGGSLAEVGWMALGTTVGSSGLVTATGAGSRMQVLDRLWVGGDLNWSSGGGATVTVDSSATFELVADDPSSALAWIFTGGTVLVKNGGLLSVPGMISNQGGIGLDGGEIVANTVSQWPTGLLDGSGRIAGDVSNNGAIQPLAGLDPFGVIEVDGSFTQLQAGHITIDLGAPEGSQCDRLAVSGAAALAGTLHLFTRESFVGDPGDAYTILTAGSLSGTFAAVTWNGAPLDGQALVLYGDDSVRVVIPGDPTGVGDDSDGTPSALRFAAVAAGAAHGGLRFDLELPAAADVEVRVFDVRGREVASVRAGSLAAGRHRLAAPAGERTLPSGVYVARAVVRQGGRATVLTARTLVVR
jgi:hypothetical protein